MLQNVSNKKALLRDQCREVKTKPLSLSEKGISVPVVGTIIGGTILFLIITMIVSLVCQRRCMKHKAIPLRPLGRVISARSAPANRDDRLIQSSRNAKAATTDDTAKVHIHDCVQPIKPFKHNTNPFLIPPPIHACANNANVNEPLYSNIFRGNNPNMIMMTRQMCTSHSSSAPPDVTETKQKLLSSDAFQCSQSRRLQRFSSVPPANIRALPVTISNHVMRSANARDMDASSEFDLHRTYFFPKF